MISALITSEPPPLVSVPAIRRTVCEVPAIRPPPPAAAITHAVPVSSAVAVGARYDTGLSSPLLRLRECSVFRLRAGPSTLALLTQCGEVLLIEREHDGMRDTTTPSTTKSSQARQAAAYAEEEASWTLLEANIRYACIEAARDLPPSSYPYPPTLHLDLTVPEHLSAFANKLLQRLGGAVSVDHLVLRLTPYLEVALGLEAATASRQQPVSPTRSSARGGSGCRSVQRGFIDSILAACADLSCAPRHRQSTTQAAGGVAVNMNEAAQEEYYYDESCSWTGPSGPSPRCSPTPFDSVCEAGVREAEAEKDGMNHRGRSPRTVAALDHDRDLCGGLDLVGDLSFDEAFE